MTLRELIAHRATTQTELAAALGVSQAMVSKWVRGERNLKYKTAAKLADALSAELVPPATPDGKWQYRPVVRVVFQMNSLNDLQYYSRMAAGLIKSKGEMRYITTNEILHEIAAFVRQYPDCTLVIKPRAIWIQTQEN